MIAVQQTDIFDRVSLWHSMAHHLKHAVKIRGDNDMEKCLRDQAGFDCFSSDHFHVFIGVVHLDLHQFI